jgi:hypothetical protein
MASSVLDERVVSGISYSAMPGFGKDHTAGDSWRLVFWIQHLAGLRLWSNF